VVSSRRTPITAHLFNHRGLNPLLIGVLADCLCQWRGRYTNFHPSTEAVRNLFITAAFSTALGAVTWNIGVAKLGINAGVMWQNMVPVFAVLISLVVFEVQPMPEQMLGGCVVLSGVLYMQWQKFRVSRAPSQA